jgi:hypothetical protein
LGKMIESKVIQLNAVVFWFSGRAGPSAQEVQPNPSHTGQTRPEFDP